MQDQILEGSSVAIALSTIAITHLYIISIQIAIMSIVKPCLHITMEYIHSCYIYHSMKIVVICWLHKCNIFKAFDP